jgi:type I restriction enzyme S subunit
MNNWQLETIGDYISIKHGFAFQGEFFSEDGKYILLTPGNISLEGGLKMNGKERSYSGEFPKSFIFNKGDLVVVMTDLIQNAPILGGGFLIPKNGKFLHNQRLGKITVKEGIDKYFLYYVMNSEFYRGQVRGSATGSTVKHTAPERIYQCKIPLPPLHIQCRIAEVLGRYDALIDNYQRQVTTLEGMAQELYREWFVRGRCLFTKPSKDVKKVKLSEFVYMNFGQSPSSEFYNDIEYGLPFHQGVGTYGRLFPNHIVFCSVEGRIAEKGDILFSVRAPVGRINIANRKLIIGRGLAALRHNNGYNHYLYQLLKDEFSSEDIIGNGSIFNAVSRKELENFEVEFQDEKIIAKYDRLITPLFAKIFNLETQLTTLRQTRDALLPKLLSGQLAVEETVSVH